MRKVFEVELGSGSGLYTELALPATPYAMLDTLEKLRLEEGKNPTWEILRACGGNLTGYLDQNSSLFELNALAQQLASLDEWQLAVVEGLAKMEHKKEARPVPLPRLIDMACSTDCCHLVEGMVTDAQLGRFCAENGFVPGADNLTDEMSELLDFERIGKQFREAEGGVFTSGGYVQKHDELRQVCKTLDLTPKKPDYAILAELSDGSRVKLPAPLGKTVVEDPAQCVDCAAPGLIGLTAELSTMDMLARRLAELEIDGELPKYKAVLEATGCDDAGWALSLADELGKYRFAPKLREYEDVAKSSLSMGLTDQQMELLLPNVNLYSFGKATVQAHGGALTGYGLVERHDREPVQGMEQEPTQGGMEMA